MALTRHRPAVGRARAGGRPRRKRVWGRFFTNSSIIAGGDVKLTPLGDFETAYGANLIGATVVRLIGEIGVLSTVATVSVQHGIMIGSATVTAGQVTPLNRYEDWMYWDSFMSAGAGFSAPEPMRPHRFDLHGARKLEEIDQELQWLLHSTTAVTFYAWVNTLVLLP